jgi:hypothetical protein
MKKLSFTLSIAVFFLLLSFNAQSQNNSPVLESVVNFPNAILEVKNFQFDPQQGYTIEIDNNECGTEDSAYLSKPVSFNSVTYNEPVGGFTAQNGVYRFEVPFSVNDLASKWFRWRVKDNNGFTSDWKCYSWSDYCTSLLNPDGTCKNK